MRIINSEGRLYRFVLYKTPSFLQVAVLQNRVACSYAKSEQYVSSDLYIVLYYWVGWYGFFAVTPLTKPPNGILRGLKINVSIYTIGGIQISLAIWPHLLVVSNQQHVSAQPECIDSPPGNTTNKSKANDKPANPTYANLVTIGSANCSASTSQLPDSVSFTINW